MSSNESDSDYSDLDQIDMLASNLTKCYQIQDLSNPKPVYIGSYEDIPLLTHIILNYDGKQDRLRVFDKASNQTNTMEDALNQKGRNRYKIHASTYILPEESVKSQVYKIAGLIIQKNDSDISTSSLDLTFNAKNKQYEYVFCDHVNNSTKTVETLNRYPNMQEVIPNLMEKIFEEPVKSIILS